MGVRLPAEYQEVEYLRSTGSQWFESNIYCESDNVEVTIDYKQASAWLDAKERDFVANTIWAEPKFGIGINGSHQFFAYSRNGQQASEPNAISNTGVLNTRYLIDVVYNSSAGTKSITVNGTTTTAQYGGKIANDSTKIHFLTMFNVNSSSAIPNAQGPVGDIYSIVYKEDGIERQHLVPCYRKLDDEPGMYDLVTGTFYANQGTGEFTAGPDVIDSISPWLVARRRLLMRKPLDTSPKIIAYDKRYVQGGSLQSSDGDCATEIYHYPVGTAMQNLYSYGANYYTLVYKNNGTTYMDWWAMATYNAPGKWGVLNKGSDGVGITLRSDMLDVCYAYIVETGEILFAGKESIYYGHKNISELN